MLGEVDLLVGAARAGRADGEHDGAERSRSTPTGLVLAIGSAGGTRLRTALVDGRRRRSSTRGSSRRRRSTARACTAPATSSTPSPASTRTALAELESAGLTVRRWPARHHYFGGVSLVATGGAAADPRRSGSGATPSDAQAGPLGPPVASTSRAIWSTAPARSRTPARREALPELDDEPLAVEVAGEAEQERLDRAARRRRSAGSCRSRSPPGDRPREAGVDPEPRDEQVRARPRGSPSGSRASRRARRPRRPSPSTSGGRPSSSAARLDARPRAAGWRIVDEETPSTQRHRPHVEAEPREQVEVAAPPVAEAEVLAGDDDAARRSPRGTRAANSSGSMPLEARA